MCDILSLFLLSFSCRSEDEPSNPPSSDPEVVHNLLGTWTFSEDCVPSVNCCCGVGEVTISETQPEGEEGTDEEGKLHVQGQVDGGLGCLRLTELEGECDVTENPDGSVKLVCSKMDGLLTVSMVPNEDYTELTMSNTLQDCQSVAMRVRESSVLERANPFVFVCSAIFNCD